MLLESVRRLRKFLFDLGWSERTKLLQRFAGCRIDRCEHVSNRERGAKRLQTQAFWNQDSIEQVKTPLDQQGENGRGNCALENCGVIVQVQTAQDWFAETAGADERGEGRLSRY